MSAFKYLLSRRLTELQKNSISKQFNDVRRFFGFCVSRQCWPKQNSPSAESLLESWYYEVDPFGLLKIKIPFNIQVKSLNPETHTKMNRVIVQIFNSTETIHDKATNLPLLYDLKTQVNDMGNEIEVTAEVQQGVTVPIECIVQAPIKMNLHIESDNGGVSVTDFENDKVVVNLQKGPCVLNNIKSGKISILSKEGKISCTHVLQGNVDLQARGKGDIEVQRLQGTSVQCKSEEGNIAIQDLYAEASSIQTDSGSINLGSIHGNTSISIGHGDLKIGSVDGDLDARVTEGQTDVYIARHEEVRIACDKGDITVKYSEDTESQLELLADSLICEPQVEATLEKTQLEKGISYKGFIKKESDACIKVSTKQGSISLVLQDWLASIGLKHIPPEN